MRGIHPTDPAHDILVLSACIGTGNGRTCWRHPHDDALCIKVAKPGKDRRQNEIDFHYGTYLVKRGIQGPHLPRMHGWVRTDQGPGLVFDLVQEPDGSPSPTLLQAMRSGLITREQAVALIDEAFGWLLEKRVILADFGLDNMLVRQLADGRRVLVFIDGLGTRNFNIGYWVRCTFGIRIRAKVKEFHHMTLDCLEEAATAASKPPQD